MLTTILAVWGALLSSAMAGFELFRFVYRARLVADVADDMLVIIPGQAIDRTPHLSFTIRNVGSQTTTLETLGAYGYTRVFDWRKPWMRWRRTKQGVINVPNVPFVLAPGAKWSEQVPQFRVQEALQDCDRIEFVVGHSMSRRELRIPHAFNLAPGTVSN